jgi:hypothetical protein
MTLDCQIASKRDPLRGVVIASDFAASMRPMTPSPDGAKGTARRGPMQRAWDQCFIQVEAAVVDRIRAMRRPDESYREVILRLVELKQAT